MHNCASQRFSLGTLRSFGTHPFFNNASQTRILSPRSPGCSLFFVEEQNGEPGRHLANLRLAFLPSSLTNAHPFTLGYSPCPPVSVCGTDTYIHNLEDFLGTLLSSLDRHCCRPRENAWAYAARICLCNTLMSPTPIL